MDIAHFLHVLGALGIAGSYAIDAAGLLGLRRSTSAEQARAWLLTRRWVLLTGPGSIGLVLITGIYMTIVEWGWVPWILTALGGLILIALIGGLLTGVPMSRVTPAIESAVGPLPESVRRGLRNPALSISITTRIAVTAGIVFLMVLKPDLSTSLLAIGIAAVCGVGLGLMLGARRPSSAPS